MNNLNAAGQNFQSAFSEKQRGGLFMGLLIGLIIAYALCQYDIKKNYVKKTT